MQSFFDRIIRWARPSGFKPVGLSALALAVILTLGMTSAQELAPDQTLDIVYIGADAGSLDPAFGSRMEEVWLIRNIHNGLVRMKSGSTDFQPDLAERWEVSDDGLEYTFYLRRGVQWHKGYGEFTAHDVKYSLERTADPATGSAHGANLRNEVASVDVIDDYTVRITLTQPFPAFLFRLNQGVLHGGIVNQKAIEEFGDDYGMNPIGTGPFMFEEYVPRERVVLVRNPDYYEGPATLERVIMHFVPEESIAVLGMQTGLYDFLGTSARDEAIVGQMTQQGILVNKSNKGAWIYMLLNTSDPALSDVRVRQAISHAIDREVVAEFLYGGFGTPLQTAVPEGFVGHAAEGVPGYEYDLDKARALLEEAGVSNLRLSIHNPALPVYEYLAVYLQDQLSQIGVQLDIDQRDVGAWVEVLYSGNLQMSILVASAYPDAHFVVQGLTAASAPPNSTNFTGMSYDALIEAARTETDPVRRDELYLELQQQIHEDVSLIPVINVFYPESRQPYVTGLEEPFDPLWGRWFYNVEILAH